MPGPGADRSPTELSDEEIIESVLDGDRELFAELIRRHSRRVYRVGLSWLKDHDEAEDLVQEVFVKAYTKLAGFRGGAKFSTWLLRIAFNSATTAKTRRREHEEFDAERAAARGPGLEEELLARERAEELRRALGELSSEQALCVELSYFQELPYADIAKVTGFPVNTIKSHMFRAKRVLRERLGSEA